MSKIDTQLAQLNATIYLFTIEPEDIQTRIIDDYEKAGWKDYLQTLGNNDEEIKEYFVHKQEQLVTLAQRSAIPVVKINSSKLSTNEIFKKVVNT
jgi:hypothetical protein